MTDHEKERDQTRNCEKSHALENDCAASNSNENFKRGHILRKL